MSGSNFHNDEGGSEDKSDGSSDAAPKSYTEIFLLHLPFYLSVGMSADEFWNGDVWLAKHYREAHNLRQKRENERLWLQGAYFYDAICAASPLIRASFGKGEVKAMPYTKEPYPLTAKEMQERQERDERKRQIEIQQRIREDMELKKLQFKQKEVKESAKRND